jgi:hypothetical protein
VANHVREEGSQALENACSALESRFQAGEFSVDVLRASLYAKGLRGDTLSHRVRRQEEILHERRSQHRIPARNS